MQIIFLIDTILDKIIRKTNSAFDVELILSSDIAGYNEYIIKNYDIDGLHVVFTCFDNKPCNIILQVQNKRILLLGSSEDFESKRDQILKKVTEKISRKEGLKEVV